MANKILGSDERIKRNKKYLSLAVDKGFFKDYPEQIEYSDEWPIVLWIDELEKKEDLNVFVNEQLPAFRRWYDAGIRTNMIGKYYYVLRMAEEKGIKIDKDSANCIMILMVPINMHEMLGKMEDPKLIEFFDKSLDDLVELNKCGIPLRHESGRNYDILMELKNNGKVDYDTFLFFAPATLIDDEYKLQLYSFREKMGKKYNYYPATTDEVELLSPYFVDNKGYNVNYVEKLNRKLKKCKDDLEKCKRSQEKNPGRFKGRVNEITRLISKLEQKIANIESRNTVEEYYKKFGTLAGLGYLKTRANEFIDLVDKDEYPIDNLFAFCFESTAFIPSDNIDELLESLKVVHDGFINNDDEIKNWNNNLPIDKYLTINEKERVTNVVLPAAVMTPDDYRLASERRFK